MTPLAPASLPRPATRPGTLPVFALAAEAIADEARALRLVVPGFRSPPQGGLLRSLRRHPSGAVTVAVAVRDRAPDAVVADMVDGLVHANRLVGADAEAVRERVATRLRRAGLPAPACEASARVA